MSKYETFWVYDTKTLCFGFEYEREHFAKKRVKALNKEVGMEQYTYARGDTYWELVKTAKSVV